ncbi:HdeD family acid-resistance protein [Cyanobium sp. Morenito 9A2]|uniref:HdeD family acid-resistance protein n=1 Tax=Cyanobium sp. Morenito 9A2 TaxID=2823718 RepID=UPI0020CE8B99|nr:DUF308 domain-containing protein [Cyanobium sp. Morenito 9A2]MCP9848275.1 DUF308 domain-containing protein [Cyanobium sp. Morenito 9A2]
MTADRSVAALASLRAFTLAEGLLMLVLGGLALVFPVFASFGATLLIAVVFLVTGLVGWVNNLVRSKRLNRWITFARLVVSTLFVLAGIWILTGVGQGVVGAARQVASLALAVGLVFLVEGVVAVVVALTHTRTKGWGWGLLNGLVTVVLGLLILTMQFGGLLQVLGVLVGISFLFSGLDLLVFSARFHGPSAVAGAEDGNCAQTPSLPS